jgi:ketosteroid isomerase-like protein
VSAVDEEGFPALLEQWAAAIVADDPERIAAFVEPDWVLVTPESGQVPGDRFLAVVSSGELTHSHMAFELLGVRLLGDVAVVTARGANRGSWQGTPFEVDEWVTEVFVRRDGTVALLGVRAHPGTGAPPLPVRPGS